MHPHSSRRLLCLVVLSVASSVVRAQPACQAALSSKQSDVQIGSEGCYTLTGGQPTSLSANTSVTGSGAGAALQLQQELVYAVNVSAPWSAVFVNVSFLGAAVWPAPQPSASAMPDALFVPAALDVRGGGSVGLMGCTIVTACASVGAWAAALSPSAGGASSAGPWTTGWAYTQLNASAMLFTRANSSRVSIRDTLLMCDPSSPPGSVTLNAAVASPDELASALPGLSTFNTSTSVTISTNLTLDSTAWQAPTFSSNLTLLGPDGAQPTLDMDFAPVVLTLEPSQSPVLTLENMQLINSCFTYNLSHAVPARLVPLSFTLGGIAALSSSSTASPTALTSQAVSVSDSTLYVSNDEMKAVLYSGAVMSAAPLFTRLPILTSFLQQLPIQGMSIRSIAGAGTASQPLSVAINSMTTPRLSFSNVTLGYAAMPIFRYPQCLTNASTVLFRSTDFFPLNVYMVRDALTLGQALSDITASGVATGSSYPPLVLLAASTQLLPSPISAYNTQRDILISGPLEDTGAAPLAFGSPTSVTLDLAGYANSLIISSTGRLFLQRLVLMNPVISQLIVGSDTTAVQRSGLPLWAFATPDGSRSNPPPLQLYQCTLILIPVDFLQLYNMAIRGSDWKTSPATNVLVQNTDVFQVQSYTACGINLVQYSGFGLNATNLLLQPDNCDATKALINTGSLTPQIVPWPPPPVSSPSGISTDAQIGIGVGVAGGVLLLASVGFAWWKLRRQPEHAGDAGKGADAMEEGLDADKQGQPPDVSQRGSQKEDPLSIWRNLYEGGLRDDSQIPSTSLDQRGGVSPLTSGDRDGGNDSRGSGALAAGAAGGNADRSVRGTARRGASEGVSSGADAPHHSGTQAQAEAAAAAAQAAAAAAPAASWDPHKEVASIASQLADEANKLVLLEPIGQGGFGTVYRGRWRNLEVAVKTVLFSEASKPGSDAAKAAAASNKRQSAHPQQRAILEAAVCTSVMHPNLVTTYHYDITPVNGGGAEARGLGGMTIDQGRNTDWKLYLVQEYCNASLQDALRNRLLHKPDTKGPDMDLVLTVLMDIARGLVYIHGKNIIHGDLTPGNVLLKQDAASPIGVVGKITDFGLCTTIDPGMTHISNVTNGTPYYVAPEVVAAGTLTKKSDVYSFGVLMWELYRCMPPWVKTDTGYALNKRFRRFPLDTPRVYVSLCARCLDKNPKERPGFDELLAALEAMHGAYLMGYDALMTPRPGATDAGMAAGLMGGGEQQLGGQFARESYSSVDAVAVTLTPPQQQPLLRQAVQQQQQQHGGHDTGTAPGASAAGSLQQRQQQQGAVGFGAGLAAQVPGTGARHDPPPRSTAFVQYFHSQSLQQRPAGGEEAEAAAAATGNGR